MKKIVSLLTVSLMIIGLSIPAYAEDKSLIINSLNIEVNDKSVANIGDPYILGNGSETAFSILYKNTAYLPVRKIQELCGGSIVYDEVNKTVKLTNQYTADESIIELTDSTFTLQDGATVPFTILYKDTAYLPIRKISEICGYAVKYEPKTKTVIINSDMKPGEKKTVSASEQNKEISSIPLPAPEPDPNSMFGVDLNINMETIDNWLGRSDVAYRDVRMLSDPAAFGDIGGDAMLSRTIKGFTIVPLPYLVTMPELPVKGAYSGKTLFTATWNKDGSVETLKTNYRESMMIMSSLFPKDKAIFLMCGGGGYAAFTRALLTYLGWDPSLIYVTGPNWEYKGTQGLILTLVPKGAPDEVVFASWLADYKYIDFDLLHPMIGNGEIYHEADEIHFPSTCFSTESVPGC